MPLNKTIALALGRHVIEVFASDLTGRKTFSKFLCRERILIPVCNLFNIPWEILPSDERVSRFIRGDDLPLVLAEKLATFCYASTDLDHRDELIKWFYTIAPRKQINHTPCLNRFVQEFFGEARKDSHLPPNLRSWVDSLTPKEALHLHKVLVKKVEKLEGMKGKGVKGKGRK